MAVTRTVRSRRGQLGLRAVSAPVAERFQISQRPRGWWGVDVGMPSTGQWQVPILRRGRRRRYGQLHHVERYTARHWVLTPARAALYNSNMCTVNEANNGPIKTSCGRPPRLSGKIPTRCTTDSGGLINKAPAARPVGSFVRNDGCSPARRRFHFLFFERPSMRSAHTL